MFSRTERCISSASARSAATYTRPARIASAGMAEAETGLPSTATSPLVGRSAPARMSNNSSWPWPSSATTPSDLARVELEGRVAAAACRRSGSRALDARRLLAPLAASRPRAALRSSADDLAEHQLDDPVLGPAVTSTTPTVSPLRRTVARSQIAAISIMRCEMKMTDRSPSRWLDDLEHALGQVRRQGGRDLVEQQDVGLDGERAGQVDDPERRQRQAPRKARQIEVPQAQLIQPVAERVERRLGQAQVVPDVEIRDDRRLLVDGDEAVAPCLGGRVRERSWPRMTMRPVSGMTAPVRILTSVLLPAPLAPISA